MSDGDRYIATACTKCGHVCFTPRVEVRKSFRVAKRRLPWHFSCACGVKTEIDTSSVQLRSTDDKSGSA